MNDKIPLFSIIITAFNQEDCIENTISSVLNQTFNNFEIIAVDDCSVDNTSELINNMAEKYQNIKFIKHDVNKSTYMARLSGVKASEGKYILFLDGDDTFYEDALFKLNDVILHDDFDVCEFSYSMDKEKIIKPISYSNVISRPEFFTKQDSVVTFVNKVYRSDIIKSALLNAPSGYMKIAEDVYQSICVAFYTKKFIQRDILVFNYDLSDGITAKKYTIENNIKNFESLKTVIICLKKFLETHADNNLKTQIFNNIQAQLYSWAKVKIKYQTLEGDMINSYLLLPTIFDRNFIEHDFYLLYSDAQKYREGFFSFKNIARHFYHKIKSLTKMFS